MNEWNIFGPTTVAVNYVALCLQSENIGALFQIYCTTGI